MKRCADRRSDSLSLADVMACWVTPWISGAAARAGAERYDRRSGRMRSDGDADHEVQARDARGRRVYTAVIWKRVVATWTAPATRLYEVEQPWKSGADFLGPRRPGVRPHEQQRRSVSPGLFRTGRWAVTRRASRTRGRSGNPRGSRTPSTGARCCRSSQANVPAPARRIAEWRPRSGRATRHTDLKALEKLEIHLLHSVGDQQNGSYRIICCLGKSGQGPSWPRSSRPSTPPRRNDRYREKIMFCFRYLS